MRIHIISNSLKTNSGFANVTRYLSIGLSRLGHEVTISGLQTTYIPEFHYGIKQFPVVTPLDDIIQIQYNIMATDPDIVIYVGDVYTDTKQFANVYPKTIVYCPVEGSVVPTQMIKNLNGVIKNGGKVIAQCKYGYEEMKKAGINVDRYIYHGFNDKIFKNLDVHKKNIKYCYYCTSTGQTFTDPLILCKQKCFECIDKLTHIEEKNTENCPFFKEEEIILLKMIDNKWTEIVTPISKLEEFFKGKFLYLFVGANHMTRKRIERLLIAYNILLKESKQIYDRVHLHLHCQPYSPTGINLLEIAKKLNIENKITFSYGAIMPNGFSEEALSILYNLADVHVSATSSEGFGICHIESMACGVPNIAPNCTSLTELIGDGERGDIDTRGYLALIESNIMMLDGSLRLLVSQEHLAVLMKKMYIQNEDRDRFGKNAIKFAQNYTWDKICLMWDYLLKEIK